MKWIPKDFNDSIRHGHFGFGPLIFSTKKREDQSQNDHALLWQSWKYYIKGDFACSVIFAIFGPILCQCDQNWILKGVCEVKFFDTTYGLAAIHFLVLAAKPLVVSKIFTSQTHFKIQFWSHWHKIGPKIAKMTKSANLFFECKYPQISERALILATPKDAKLQKT